jgi:hypothetical protein
MLQATYEFITFPPDDFRDRVDLNDAAACDDDDVQC